MAAQEPAGYNPQVIEHDQWKRLPGHYESLSSLRRPFAPPHSSPPTESAVDGLLSLHTNLLHYLLRFVSMHEFFFCFPFLSHAHQHAYTHPDLHRPDGQQRFDLTDYQWRLFSGRSWPQLHTAIWKHRYQQEEAQKKWNQHGLRGEDEEHDDGVEETEADATRQAEVSVLSLKETEQPIVGLTPPADKDWALECTHLYHHLRFAALYIMRYAPNVTSSGDRIVYRLPRLINALIVDQLTSQHVMSIVRGERRYTGVLNLLELDYASFTFPFKPCDPVSLSLHPIVNDERTAAAEPPFIFLSASMETEAVQVARRWTPSQHDDEDENVALRELFAYNAGEEGGQAERVIRHLDETAMLGSVDSGWDRLLQAIWFGPQLRRAVDEHKVAQGKQEEQKQETAVVEVELEDSAIVEYRLRFAHELPFVVALHCTDWLKRGCISGGISEQEAVRVAEWMGLERKSEAETKRESDEKESRTEQRQRSDSVTDEKNEGEDEADGQEDQDEQQRFVSLLSQLWMDDHRTTDAEARLEDEGKDEQTSSIMAEWQLYISRIAVTLQETREWEYSLEM